MIVVCPVGVSDLCGSWPHATRRRGGEKTHLCVICRGFSVVPHNVSMFAWEYCATGDNGHHVLDKLINQTRLLNAEAQQKAVNE